MAQIQDMATGAMLDLQPCDVTPSQLLVTIGKVADGASADVPCGECTACCWYGRTDVNLAEETPEDLAYLNLQQDEMGYFLAHRPDGGCYHLGPQGGCSVHAHRPRVCRAYDCRVLGLAGLASRTQNGHCAPVWLFPVETPLDRAIIAAARMAAEPYMEATAQGKEDPPGNVLANILKGTYENLPHARAMVEWFDKLPPEEQRRLKEAEEQNPCQQEPTPKSTSE